MRTAWGHTRWVILISFLAFKIARTRPIWFCVYKLCVKLRDGTAAEGLSNHHPNKVIAVFKYVFVGIVANRLERKLYLEKPELAIAPTYFSFFGLVNIQKRGSPVADYEIDDCPFRELSQQDLDVSSSHQFARFGKDILLVDYGYSGLVDRLMALS